MVSQAILGSAKLVRDTKIHPGKLKDNVTSSGGTAIEALYSLEKNSFRGIVMQSIQKCTEKSAIISQRNE
jgi:pyrroline-5-carboxylate reductase